MDLIEKAIVQAVQAIVERGAETARDNVPVQTGELKESIRVETLDEENGVVSIYLAAGGDPDQDGIIADYAAEIEVRSPYLAEGQARIEGELRRLKGSS